MGLVKENHQPRQGEILPLMERSNGLPGEARLPDKAKLDIAPWNGKEPLTRSPVLRLLVIHGVADSFNQGWHLLAAEAPPDIEVAMHEFPGHGHRSEEEIMSSLEELSNDCFEAFREAMDTGTFALLCHSIGCLVGTVVAKRARAELGVEPVLVFMVERGAPVFPKWTPEGLEVLKTDPERFLGYFQPNAVSLLRSAGDLGKRTFDMWRKGWFIECDTLEVGYHVFKCPIVAIYAETMVHKFVNLSQETDDAKKDFFATTLQWDNNFKNGRQPDGTNFAGHFPLPTYKEWDKWTEHSKGVTILNCRDTDHMSIKTDPSFKLMVWEHLREVIKQF